MAAEGTFLESSTHRAYGNFARVLGQVRSEEKNHASGTVRRLSGLPAATLPRSSRLT